ncbi:MAG: zinc ribbon domain-containing protein [Chloroflexi bacterium]|nr:zinc ribbon domain-containing protein [Chloroflexota bacterium]
MKCPQCRTEIEPGSKFCDGCGAPIREPVLVSTGACPSCRAGIEPGDTFCASCGTALSGKAPTTARRDTRQKTSAAWWFVPFLLALPGGVIAWAALKDRDPNKAKRLLLFGITMTLLWIANLTQLIVS